MVETLLLFIFGLVQTFRTLLPVVPKRDTSLQATNGLALVFLLVSCGCICVGILPYILHLFTIPNFLPESCHNSCCTTISILHATLDLFLDWICHQTCFSRARREFHFDPRLSQQCVEKRRSRNICGFRSRLINQPALLELMESSKQGRIKNEMDDDEYSESTVDSTLPLQLAKIANGRPMKDARLEFVDWARDGRYQLTPEDDKVWLHMKARTGRKALVDDGSEAGLEHWRLVLNFSATRAKLHRVNTSLGCAVTCSSYILLTRTHIL